VCSATRWTSCRNCDDIGRTCSCTILNDRPLFECNFAISAIVSVCSPSRNRTNPLIFTQSRQEVLDILCTGLAREEYRGYDSAGLAVDGDTASSILYFKEVGKVAGLKKKIAGATVDKSKCYLSQVSIAHTRWATHGPPSERNCHPVKSDPTSEFIVVHNGIVTNAAELRLVLQKRGYKFETDTDTETAAVLTKYVYDSQQGKRISFTDLVKAVLKELEGSFAFVFKSIHYPNEVVTARRGSPLLIGVKTDKKLKVDFVDVEFAGHDSDSKTVEASALTSFQK
jgi:glucosamine--fructose-6-phosphate aminotransferase (isomerizing)